MDKRKKAENRRTRLKSNLLLTLAVIGGYIVIYLAGRIFGTDESQMSVTEWLFGNDPQQLRYLYGWLLHQHIFWVAMAISAIPALFGKKYFSFTTLFGFAIALLIGELCGHNPAGSTYGHGHYGWAILGRCIFAFSVVMGIILERKSPKEKFELRSKKDRDLVRDFCRWRTRDSFGYSGRNACKFQVNLMAGEAIHNLL